MTISTLALLTIGLTAGAIDPWPMERQDRWGTAHAVVGISTTDYVSPWISKKFANANYFASHGPAIVQGNIGYIGTWVDSKVHKFNTLNEAFLGSFQSDNWVQSTPAVGPSGAIYAHAVKPYSFSPPGRLFKIDPTTMDFDWFFNTNFEKQNDWEAPSPTLGPDGDVVIGSTTGQAWRIDDLTGTPIWTTGSLGGVIRTIVFSRDDSMVFVSNGTRVTALNYSNGSVAWNIDLGSTMGAPGVAPSGTIVVGNAAGTIYGLNPATGAVLWTRATLNVVRPAPAFSNDGVAYVCSDDWRLYAIRVTDGVRLWTFTGSHENRNAPAVGFDNRIYFGNRTGTVYCVNPDGTLQWQCVVPGAEFRGPTTIGPDAKIYAGWLVLSQQAAVLAPTSFLVTNGTLVSGGIPQVIASDNQRMDVRVGSDVNDEAPFAGIAFATSGPTNGCSALKIKMELSCTFGFIPQKIMLFNYVTNAWEIVDSRNATVGDSIIEVTIASNQSRFIQSGSHTLRARVYWGTDSADIEDWHGYIDHVEWTMNPNFEP
jgi:outer membrane protein assembly factor BamB